MPNAARRPTLPQGVDRLLHSGLACLAAGNSIACWLHIFADSLLGFFTCILSLCSEPPHARQVSPSQSPLEERRCDEERADTEDEQKKQIVLNGHEAAVFEEDGFEAVDGVGEGVDCGDGAEPAGKLCDGRDGAGGEEEQRVEYAEQ